MGHWLHKKDSTVQTEFPHQMLSWWPLPWTPENSAIHHQARINLDSDASFVTKWSPNWRLKKARFLVRKNLKLYWAEVLALNRSRFITTHSNHYPNLHNSLKWDSKEGLKPNSWQPNKEKSHHTLLRVFKAAIKMWARLHLHLEAQLETNLLPSSFRWLAEFISLWLYDWLLHHFASSRGRLPSPYLRSCLEFAVMCVSSILLFTSSSQQLESCFLDG